MFRDALLQSNDFRFSIDEIYLSPKYGLSAHLIPDIKSNFFPPYHLRTIRFSARFLTQNYFNCIKHRLDFSLETNGGVEQGAYYNIPTDLLLDPYAFSPEVVIEKDIFTENKLTSPYKDSLAEYNSHFKELSLLDTKGSRQIERIYLYCFNVGQGDTFVLITSTGNVYLIDTNFYSESSVNNFIEAVKVIMREHGLDDKVIKALLITHKHIDHLRGADYLINSGEFDIVNFLMNFDYNHPTVCVHKLLVAAKKHIPNWININKRFLYADGDTRICIQNPDVDTATSLVAPDINDSSITLCVSYGDNSILLTGDAGSEVLEKKMSCTNLTKKKNRVLKVSHHGSRTGTDSKFLDICVPTHAFVSAGYSTKYKHPHSEVIKMIRSHSKKPKTYISKEIKRTLIYEITKDEIKTF